MTKNDDIMMMTMMHRKTGMKGRERVVRVVDVIVVLASRTNCPIILGGFHISANLRGCVVLEGARPFERPVNDG